MFLDVSPKPELWGKKTLAPNSLANFFLSGLTTFGYTFPDKQSLRGKALFLAYKRMLCVCVCVCVCVHARAGHLGLRHRK